MSGKANIGQRIKALRKSRALSQESLAMKIGISQTYLSDLELSKGRIDVEDLLRIAAALDYPVVQFLPGHTSPGHELEEVTRWEDEHHVFITYKRPKAN